VRSYRLIPSWPAITVLTVALFASVMSASSGAAGGYDAVVLADHPTMYWRFGEPDGATTAADSSGNGVTLTYASGALLDLEAGIQGSSDTSVAGDIDPIANQISGEDLPGPGALEVWLRTNVPDAAATVYFYQDPAGTTYRILVDTDGLLHVSVVGGGVCCQGFTATSPASKPVTDGFWHYVVVNFATGYVYVDLIEGPPPTPAEGPAARSFVTSPISIGGSGFDGQLDEMAVYAAPLTSVQMSSHASSGGLGWDADVVGGEEGAAAGCLERGLFWKGAANSTGTVNYAAHGAQTYITTTKKRNRCGTAVSASSGNRPTFITGQTVRVKLNQDTPLFYAEWGPVHYLCNQVTTCWGLFFNLKLDGIVNHVCFVSFRLGNFLQLQGCPAPTSQVQQTMSNCAPTGTHGWRIQHEGSSWAGYFLCNVNATPQNWLRVFSHSDHGYAPVGFPDVEGFNQGYKCGTRTTSASCWRREGFMAETHSNFRWLNASGQWNNVAFGVCREDRSLRTDGQQTTFTPPISIRLFENHRSTGC
jgi:hypothetical protein